MVKDITKIQEILIIIDVISFYNLFIQSLYNINITFKFKNKTTANE